MTSIPKVGESLNPAPLEHMEDNLISLSLLSLLCDVRKALQFMITNEELYLNDIGLTQVNSHKDGIPTGVIEQLRLMEEDLSLGQVG